MSETTEATEAVPVEPSSSPVTDRSHEIPALLETDPPEEAAEVSHETLPAVEEGSAVSEISSAAAPAENALSAAMQTLSVEITAIRSDLAAVRESLQTFHSGSQQMAARLDGIAGSTDTLAGKVNQITLDNQLMSAELETLVSASGSGKMLSKVFLMGACVVIAIIAGFQIYMYTSLIQVEKLQEASGSKLLESFKLVDKKLAEFTSSQPKEQAAAPAGQHGSSPAHPNQADHGNAAALSHTPQPPPSGQLGNNATHGEQIATTAAIPLQEKLNRLRNGQAERKLVRKENGDWFLYSKKTDECIADSEVIEALNQAYKRLGRPLTTKTPLPAHNSLCILKPDGKGGTEIVMTKNFVP